MLYITSDLHFGVSMEGDTSVKNLAKKVCEQSLPEDILCIAGDIGSSSNTLNDCLDLFSKFLGNKCAIAGNHDIWVTNGLNSWGNLQQSSAIFREHGFHPLEEEPLITDSLAIAGTMGWYDYSFQDSSLGLSAEDYKRKYAPNISTSIWADALHVRWPYTDAEVTRMLANKLALHLESIDHKKPSCVIMHHLPTKRLLTQPRWLVPKHWRFLNTYLGSQVFEGIITSHPNVSHVVSGHVHMERKVKLGNQTFTTVGGDYATKQVILLDKDKISRLNF